MSEAETNIPVAVIGKNKGSEVRVALTTFRDQHLVDLRTYLAFTGDGELRATKKGVSLSVTRLRELRSALDDAERRAVAMGWLERGAAS